MRSQERMRINLDIQSNNKKEFTGKFKLRLHSNGLQGTVDIESAKYQRETSKEAASTKRKTQEKTLDHSRSHLSLLYRNLKKINKNPTLETQRKQHNITLQTHRHSTMSGFIGHEVSMSQGLSHTGGTSKNDTNKCEIIVIEGNQKRRHFYSVGNVGELINYLRKYNSPDVVTYVTSPTNIAYDFYLTQEDRDASFLNGKTIQLQPYYRNRRKKIDMRCFEIIKCIGAGGFSKVFLVRFKEDGRFYAMKLIDKHFIIENKKKGIVENERNIMIDAKHPFTLELKFSFETADFLVFVMEYCPGGELFNYVKKFKRMPEEIARFYMVQIILGIEYLHEKDIIYRDIKPENILIDMDGHVRIADFGLAKPNIGKSDMAHSFCGSPQYMAPEMILKIGHGRAVDFYCLGALLYQLVTGLPPFYSKNTQQIYQAVLTQDLIFPKHTTLSSECKSLLNGLLNKNYKYRLGSLMGAKEVLAHPWFGRIKKQDYLLKNIPPPVKIDDIQTINFDFGKLKENDNDFLRLIEDQKKTENQFFKKYMKEFYYDPRVNSDIENEEPETLYTKIETRYLSPRNYNPNSSTCSTQKPSYPFAKRESGGTTDSTPTLYPASYANSKLKKVSSGNLNGLVYLQHNVQIPTSFTKSSGVTLNKGASSRRLPVKKLTSTNREAFQQPHKTLRN